MEKQKYGIGVNRRAFFASAFIPWLRPKVEPLQPDVAPLVNLLMRLKKRAAKEPTLAWYEADYVDLWRNLPPDASSLVVRPGEVCDELPFRRPV